MNSIFNIWNKYQKGTATKKEKKILLKALKEDHKDIKEIISASWDSAGEEYENPNDKEQVWNSMLTRIEIAKKAQVKTYIKYGIAASLIIFLSFSFFWLKTEAQPKTVEVAVGESVKEVVLPDGSKAWLNSGSSLTYLNRFESDKRIVKLSGNAFFEVERDENRPFKIDANTVEVEVLGTSFDVYNYQDESPSVSVVTGKVRVTHLPSKTSIKLRKNQQALLDDIGQLIKVDVNANNFIKWRESILYFDEVRLEKVIKKLERKYGVNIKCNNQELLNSRIKAEYKNESLNTVMDDLTFLTNSIYTFNENMITIIPKN